MRFRSAVHSATPMSGTPNASSFLSISCENRRRRTTWGIPSAMTAPMAPMPSARIFARSAGVGESKPDLPPTNRMASSSLSEAEVRLRMMAGRMMDSCTIVLLSTVNAE